MDGPILNARSNEGAPVPTMGPDELVALSRELLHAARALEDGPDALPRLVELAARLPGADPAVLAHDNERTAFWLNVYNALARQALHLEQARGNLLLKLGIFSRAAYDVGALRYSLNHIEHGLLRGNRRPPNGLFRTLGEADARLARAPATLDPRIHFALNCGARSCPPIRSYEPARLDAQLDLATRAYFETECSVDRARGVVTLPRLCKYYRGDFGDTLAAVRFAARHLPESDGAWLAEHATTVSVRYADYDWSIVTAPPAA